MTETRLKEYWAVLPAGGSGTRMGASIPKQLLQYKGRAVLEKAALPFLEDERITGAVIVIPSQGEKIFFQEIAEGLHRETGKTVAIVRGGSERRDSVMKGLEYVKNQTKEKGIGEEDVYVLIHDGARPEVTEEIIDRNIRGLDVSNAVCTVVPAVDSMRFSESPRQLRQNDGWLIMDSKVLERRFVYNVQTPQSFRLKEILGAYAVAAEAGYLGTDDASVAQYAGIPVALVNGELSNIKITTRKDMPMTVRTGTGFDVHRFAEGRPLILCGTPVPSSVGLLGHSDADVATHALMDALLGAAGKGDIGEHFPDTDDRYLGADSLRLLEETMKIIGDWQVVNADVTIIAQKPKLSPYKGEMRKRIAEVLRIDEDRVNIKATTTEGLGFTGAGEGMAAIAAVTIEGRF